jgi:hypothetical protein
MTLSAVRGADAPGSRRTRSLALQVDTNWDFATGGGIALAITAAMLGVHLGN